jgi:sister-chromatid-cohesion protein PDS5
MRISAPKAPYDDNTMKEIFQLLVDSFQGLDDVTGSQFTRRVTILETFAKIRSGNIMIDMGLNDLILKMFHQFFATIRKYHASNVITAMHSIMTLIVNESDEVPQSLYSILSANMLKGDKKSLSVKQVLAEMVIAQCEEKLKPFLAHEEHEEEEEFISEIYDGEDALSHEECITKTQDDLLD